eukprot:TRINITY_DN20274_c0_g1_i1.p3 TRINITY_DN20274_c0_g1~~TRINITY_DN20274_c0_g1_i1.p3  ORF type:complete len:124 (+),score=5.77 TRINITY_DN20274_c0_g1_i1:324-695(+)
MQELRWEDGDNRIMMVQERDLKKCKHVQTDAWKSGRVILRIILQPKDRESMHVTGNIEPINNRLPTRMNSITQEIAIFQDCEFYVKHEVTQFQYRHVIFEGHKKKYIYTLRSMQGKMYAYVCV